MWVPGHGLGREFYQVALDALWSEHRITSLVVTLPGFDGEPCQREPCWRDWSRDLAAQLPALLPSGGFLVGHSLGTVFAALAALDRPAGLRGLVLLEPLLQPSGWLARMAARRYRAGVVDRPLGEFRNRPGTARRIARLRAYPAWAIDHYRERSVRVPREFLGRWLEKFPEIYPLPLESFDLPVMVVRGKRSGTGVWLSTRSLSRRFPRGQLVTIPGAAHWLFNEADHVLVAALARFCGGVP